MAQQNITNIPPPRVPFIDERTGLISREWYRYLFALFNVTGVGSNPTPLPAFEITPLPQPDNSQDVTVIEQTLATAPAAEQVSAEINAAVQQTQLASLQEISAQIQQALQELAVTPAAPEPADQNTALELAPAIRESNTLNTNYLDFEVDAPKTDQLGRIGWNPSDQTLDIGMDYSVVQQVGMETYARVENATGVTIPNGTVVGFAGVGANNTLSVTPFVADGTVPTLYILGIMTHDLPNSGEVGYCTTWGHVRGLDTSAFSVGDVLYADPATPGGLTAAKPTAPNAVVPIAAVLQVDATDGEIFVRPTIEQQKYYATFSDTTTQTAAAVYTPYPISFDTTNVANGFTRVGTPATQITASVSGLYNFSFSLQVTSTSANAQKIWVWPRLNGSDIAHSNSEATISGGNAELVLAWDFNVSMAANDYFELMFAVDNTNVQLLARAATAGANGTATFARPAVPSVILNVTQVQQ